MKNDKIRLKEYRKNYYLKNKEKIIKKCRQYTLSHPDIRRKANRNFYIRHKDKILQYRKEHKEQVKFNTKKYKKSLKGKLSNKKYNHSIYRKEVIRRYNTSPRGIIVNRLKVLRRNERKRKLDVKIDIDDINKTLELYKHKCFNCNAKTRLEIDHYYPISKGYGIMYSGFNIGILCRKCNAEKNNKLPEEFYSKDKIEEFKRIKEKFLFWKKEQS